MKIVILGATGPTGQQLTRQALEKGFEVTAVVRNPRRLPLQHELLTIVRADILNEQSLASVFKGKDAVLSALGTGKKLRSRLVSLVMPTLIVAMQKAGVNRVIFLSSFGVGETRKQVFFFSRMILTIFLGTILRDKKKADSQLRQSELNYTLVYPTRLTNGPITHSYSVGERLTHPGRQRISRADVADFMIRQLTDASWFRRTAIITT